MLMFNIRVIHFFILFFILKWKIGIRVQIKINKNGVNFGQDGYYITLKKLYIFLKKKNHNTISIY